MERLSKDNFTIISKYLDDKSFRELHRVSRTLFERCYRQPRWHQMLKERLGETAHANYPAQQERWRAMYFYVAWLNKTEPGSNVLTLGIVDTPKLENRRLIHQPITQTWRTKLRGLLSQQSYIEDMFPMDRLVDLASYQAWDRALRHHLFPTTGLNQTVPIGELCLTGKRSSPLEKTKCQVVIHRMNVDVFVRMTSRGTTLCWGQILETLEKSKFQMVRIPDGRIFTTHPRGAFHNPFTLHDVPKFIKKISWLLADIPALLKARTSPENRGGDISASTTVGLDLTQLQFNGTIGYSLDKSTGWLSPLQ